MSILSYQHKLINMHAELAGLNHCSVPFLSRAGVKFAIGLIFLQVTYFALPRAQKILALYKSSHIDTAPMYTPSRFTSYFTKPERFC